jgi:glyoxylase-like metal-dependent hydrolase (beta-lactamase superfamily II)
MKLGDWEVLENVAGKFKLDGGAMFGVVPKTIWSKLIPADEFNRIPMALRTMVARSGEKLVLVDAGAGGSYPEKLRTIYQFEGAGGAGAALSAMGVEPEQVTDIIVTHLHFDHGGGLADLADGSWRLNFPNAVHHIHRDQWRHALSPTPRDRASYFKERIKLIEDEGALELHDSDWELAPGFEIVVVGGHTPGQQLPKISGDGETVFYCGDLIPTSAHIPVPYIMAYDLDPVLAMEEKEKYLREAVEGNWILFFEHDPTTAACRAVYDGKRFGAGDPVRL